MSIRDCLSNELANEPHLKSESKEKLVHLSNLERYARLLDLNPPHLPTERLGTILEANSTDSLMSMIADTSEEKSEEDLELSGTVRSYRDLYHNKENKRADKEAASVISGNARTRKSNEVITAGFIPYNLSPFVFKMMFNSCRRKRSFSYPAGSKPSLLLRRLSCLRMDRSRPRRP